jgi:hypothetical protein
MLKTSRAVIDKWIEKAGSINHIVEPVFDTDDIISGDSLINLIISLRNGVERWDLELLTTHILVNPVLEFYILKTANQYISEIQNKHFMWGMELFSTPHIQPEYILVIDNNNQFDDARHIAVGKLGIANLQRLVKLKAFW